VLEQRLLLELNRQFQKHPEYDTWDQSLVLQNPLPLVGYDLHF
jgi:hypothetical protein